MFLPCFLRKKAYFSTENQQYGITHIKDIILAKLKPYCPQFLKGYMTIFKNFLLLKKKEKNTGKILLSKVFLHSGEKSVVFVKATKWVKIIRPFFFSSQGELKLYQRQQAKNYQHTVYLWEVKMLLFCLLLKWEKKGEISKKMGRGRREKKGTDSMTLRISVKSSWAYLKHNWRPFSKGRE